jgi:drug/metabolite transporter (DMT)-like permease
LLWKNILSLTSKWIIITTRSFTTFIIGTIIITVLFPEIITALSLMIVYKCTLAAIFGALGLISMISALKEGSLKQLGIYNLFGIVLTVSYLVIFENIEIKYYLLGTTLIILGFLIYFFSIPTENQKENNPKVQILFFIMSVFFAISGLIHWNNLKQGIPAIYSLVNQEFIVFLFGLFGLIFNKKNFSGNIFTQIESIYKQIILMAFVILGAVWSGFIGLKNTNPIITSLMALSLPIFTILFGNVFFKEKLKAKTIISIALIALGAFILHLNLKQ